LSRGTFFDWEKQKHYSQFLSHVYDIISIGFGERLYKSLIKLFKLTKHKFRMKGRVGMKSIDFVATKITWRVAKI